MIEALKKPATLPEGKDLTVYIVLAVLLGGLGVHNLWAGNMERGKAQLIIGLIGWFLCGIPTLVIFVTAILDIVNVLQAKQK